MKKALLIIMFVLPVVFLQAKEATEITHAKSHRKEIRASRLPETVTGFIYSNLPHAKITKVIKQRGNPKEKYFVTFVLRTKSHTMVFDKKGGFVRLVKGPYRSSVPKLP